MMKTHCVNRLFLLAAWASIFGYAPTVFAAQAMNMPGVENSVGYLSSGTSVQPATTSESAAMVHKTIGNWMAMVHANAFLVDIQQNGQRGGDKFFSTNWAMPMLVRP